MKYRNMLPIRNVELWPVENIFIALIHKLLINKNILTQWEFKCEFWFCTTCHTFLPQTLGLIAAFNKSAWLICTLMT
jgi:hypothetical protein